MVYSAASLQSIRVSWLAPFASAMSPPAERTASCPAWSMSALRSFLPGEIQSSQVAHPGAVFGLISLVFMHDGALDIAGGLIMSASHNPGGPKEDWGIKFNYSSGEPAPERITDAIFGYTKKISELKMADIPETDLSKIGTHSYGDFEVS